MKKVDNRKKLIRAGLAVACSDIYDENDIWCYYSNDKVNIGQRLMGVLRTLDKAFPLRKRLNALSLGSGNEPQFKILEAAAEGGLYLLDVDKIELDAVRERLRRQAIGHVLPIKADFDRIFLDRNKTRAFVEIKLKGKRVDLITLHHSLYYCETPLWEAMLENLYREVLAPRGAIHAVLMASRNDDRRTTTWLYNHFAGKFFGVHNDQDLRAFGKTLGRKIAFRNARILARTDRVRFSADAFKKLMAVVWMILLYPEVHKYSSKQREEIAGYVYDNFWKKGLPLVQMQDHLAIYKGFGSHPVSL